MKSDKVLDHLAYIQKRIFKGFALFLATSTLSESERLQWQELSTPLLNAKKALLFTLKNEDTLLFFNNNKAPVLMDLIFQLKTIIPNLQQKHFDLKKQFDTLSQLIYDIQIFPSQKKALKVLKKLPTNPLTLNQLENLLILLTPACLMANLPVQNNCLKLDLTYLRQKLFPQIDLTSNPILAELLYQQLTKRIPHTSDLFYPTYVLDLSDKTPPRIILRLSDIIKHLSVYQSYRNAHPDTHILIQKDISASALNLTKLQDCFVSFL